MITSADDRLGTVRCPTGVVRDQPDTVRCPSDFTRMKPIFTCNDEYINIKIRNHSFHETGCLNKKDWGWLWQWWRWKSNLLKTAKLSMALVRYMLFILSCSSEIYIIVLSLQKWFIYVDAITRRFSPVAVRLIKHRRVPGRASSGARTGIGRFVKRFSKVPGAFQTSYDARFLVK